MSPVFEPFGVVPHVLYIFHSSQLPPAILKRKYTALEEKDVLPFTHKKNEK